MLCEIMKGNVSRIRDRIDVLGHPHLHIYGFYQGLSIEEISWSFALLATFSWGCANEATPHCRAQSVWGFRFWAYA